MMMDKILFQSVWKEWQECGHHQTANEPLALPTVFDDTASKIHLSQSSEGCDKTSMDVLEGSGGTDRASWGAQGGSNTALGSSDTCESFICSSPAKDSRRGWLVKRQSSRTLHLSEKVCKDFIHFSHQSPPSSTSLISSFLHFSHLLLPPFLSSPPSSTSLIPLLPQSPVVNTPIQEYLITYVYPSCSNVSCIAFSFPQSKNCVDTYRMRPLLQCVSTAQCPYRKTTHSNWTETIWYVKLDTGNLACGQR